MSATITRDQQEKIALQTQTGLTTNFSLHDLRIAYYGGKVSQNDSIRAFLQSQLSNTTTQSLNDLWRLYFIMKGIANLSSLGDMAKLFFTNVGFSNAPTHYSLLFDGATDRAQVDQTFASALSGLHAGTIECFFKTSLNSGAFQKLLKMGNAYDLGINNNGDLFGEIVLADNIGIFTGAVNDGAWHHVALSWDGTTVRGCFDGAVGGSGAQAADQGVGSSPLYIGQNNGGEYLAGNIKEIRISNIARYTGSYTKPAAEFTNDANTLLLLHTDEGSGSTLTDSSSNGNNGALDGTHPPTYSTDVPF